MNVAQMKEALSHYPDDAEIGVHVGGAVTPVTDTSAPGWGVCLHVAPLTDEFVFHPALLKREYAVIDSGDVNRG